MLLLFGSFASAGTGQPLAVVSTLSGDVSVIRAGSSIPLKFKAEAFPTGGCDLEKLCRSRHPMSERRSAAATSS